LCKFKWQTSAPIVAGFVNPTCAFILAPSKLVRHYRGVISLMALSKRHVLKDKLPSKQIIHLYISMFSLTSSTSILPFSIVLVTIIVIPAIAADAGFVPCAEAGIRQIVLCDLL
jgi:hypothetical protein